VIYFDTSVLAAYYTPEERSAEAAAIVESASSSFSVVSDLAIAELNVVIVRKGKQGHLSPEGVAGVFSLFDEHLRDSFLNISIETRHIEATRTLAAKSAITLRTLDALHLVIASEVEGTLATFDQRLRDAALSLGFSVLP
jgi:predicted nucleic acid-binding protein